MMRITICGPNLMDQSKGSFHIHAEGCGDLTRRLSREPEYANGWTIDAEDRAAATLAIYEDQIAEGSSTFEQARGDLWFMDCCAGLPEGPTGGGR